VSSIGDTKAVWQVEQAKNAEVSNLRKSAFESLRFRTDVVSTMKKPAAMRALCLQLP
jgi:hypothetical protein